MDDVISPFREDLLDGTGHLRPPVTTVFVGVTIFIILVDPAEISAIVLSIINQFADFEVRVRDEPLHRLRMEDNRGGILRILVGGVDHGFRALEGTFRDVRSNLDQRATSAIVEAFRERTAVEHITSVALLRKKHLAIGAQQVVHTITPADVLTDVLVDLDQLFDGGAIRHHVEDGSAVIGDCIAVISSVVRVEGVVDLTQNASRKNTRRGREITDRGQIVGDGTSGTKTSLFVETCLNAHNIDVGQIIVVVTLDPLNVDVVGQDLDVVVYIVNREGRGANVFQADPIRLDSLLAERKVLLIEGVADFLDGSQAGVVLTSFASNTDGLPTAARGNRAAGDGVGDRFAHVVGKCRLGDKTEVRIFIKTQAMGTKSNASSLALELITDGLTSCSSLC